MRFLFTGTASGVPVGHRRHASLLIEEGADAVLVDAGEGVTAGLLQAGVALDAVTRLIITHTHADHVSGLPMLLQGMHLARRERPLVISVPPGRVQWVREWLRGMYIVVEKWSFEFRVQQYGDGRDGGEDAEAAARGLRIAPFANRHLEKVRELAAKHDVPAGSYSLHVSGRGASAVISSDVAGTGDVAAMAAGCDLLVMDATHVPQDDILALAAEHPALRIICTHLPPELEEELPALAERSARETGGRILYAQDGMEYRLEHSEA